MPVNLYALCRPQRSLVIKRVPVTQGLQAKLEGVFQNQLNSYLASIEEEVPFTGDWKPDDEELLVIDTPNEGLSLTEIAADEALAKDVIDSARIDGENIKALAVVLNRGTQKIIAIQIFNYHQILSRKIAMILDGTSFRELEDAGFILQDQIHAFIENGKLKFKSFHVVKRIFDLTEFFQEATDEQIEQFCGHENISAADSTKVKKNASTQTRRMIHAVLKTGVLDFSSVEEVCQRATIVGINLKCDGNKLVLPDDKRELKVFLRFFTDDIYKAPLSDATYMTNSKRKIG